MLTLWNCNTPYGYSILTTSQPVFLYSLTLCAYINFIVFGLIGSWIIEPTIYPSRSTTLYVSTLTITSPSWYILVAITNITFLFLFNMSENRKCIIYFILANYLNSFSNVILFFLLLLDLNLFVIYDIYIINEIIDFHPEENEQEIVISITAINLSN